MFESLRVTLTVRKKRKALSWVYKPLRNRIGKNDLNINRMIPKEIIRDRDRVRSRD